MPTPAYLVAGIALDFSRLHGAASRPDISHRDARSIAARWRRGHEAPTWFCRRDRGARGAVVAETPAAVMLHRIALYVSKSTIFVARGAFRSVAGYPSLA
jgi:hypothetical protein